MNKKNELTVAIVCALLLYVMLLVISGRTA